MFMTKAEKAGLDLAEINQLVRAEPAPGVVSQTVNVEHALAILRSENARLKDCARVNAEREARNEEMREKNRAHGIRETLRLQNELLASQERIVELQDQLLALRRIVNHTGKE
jgi:hypothetical protein